MIRRPVMWASALPPVLWAAVPFVLVPPALYVALLPLADTTVSLRQILLTGAAGVLGVGLPALAIHVAEVRAGRRTAVALLVLAAALGVVGIASGAGVLEALAVVLVLQAAAYGCGRRLVRWCDPEGGGGAASLARSLAAGWGVLVVLGLALGHLGYLSRPAVAAAGLIGIALAVGAARSAPRGASLTPASRTPDGDRDVPMAWWWGFVVLLLVGFVGAAAPEVRHDALTAHLPIAREFATRGRIVEMRQNAASYFQLNADLLYAMGMLLLPGDAVPKLLHFAAGAAASLIVYGIGARLWRPRVGLAAAAVVAGTPLWWWVGGTAYTDLWAALFAVAALDGLLGYAQRPGPGRAGLVGLFAGAAVGTKITSVATVAPIVAALAVWSLRSSNKRRRALSLACLVAAAAASGAYWYARAWTLTGDPVYPLSRLVFPSGAPRAVPLGPTTFGAGRAPQDLLLLPWSATRHPEWFVEDGWLGIAYFAALPAALIAAARGRIPRWFVVIFVAAGLFWALSAQYLRYLLPALPLAALLAAAGALGRPGPAHRGWVAVFVLALALGAGAWAAPGPPNFPWPVAARTVTHDAYLERYVPGYRIAEFARRELPSHARILGAGEDRAWLYAHFFVPISWYGRRYQRDLRAAVLAARTGTDLERVLTQAGFTHLVLYPDYPLAGLGAVGGSWVARAVPWGEGPRLEYADAGRYLFAIASPSGPRRPGRTVFHQAQVMRAAGEPVVHSVPVAAGALYGLEVEIRSEMAGNDADLAVRWTDPGGRTIGAGVQRRLRAADAWATVHLAGTAPRGAVAARIEISAVGPQAVEARALRFFELR